MMNAFPFIIFFVWLVAFNLILPKVNSHSSKNYQVQKKRLYKILGYEKIQNEAVHNGINISPKEFISITLFAVISGIIISLLTKNYFFIIIGFALCFMLPKYILSKTKRSKREEIMFELPDNLKTFTSKLIDFASIQSALEKSVPDMHGQTKVIFQTLLEDLKTGFSLQTALEDAKNQVKIQRFTDFCEKLQMADEQGYNDESIKSLKETTREFGLDNTMIRELYIKSKKEKRSLTMIIVMAWALPVILSTMNVSNTNVFLDTFAGQFYIALFVLLTLFAIVKSDEWLAVNLEEL
ncbi:hypothetical protein ABE82_26980 (plasmid) [Paenibacillus peoriae]|uniref:type II secretion system F family protein n=1 Tax=Paenibacillus peoriae TaxID=59893 RepID=UPI000720FFD2|nr:hypothetical protein [Paenibacillus peoriae]ALS10050.1 hypothetical protein ABE82_26980 [Paenibacillus peoriae]